jgi:neutral ceramidase
MKMVRRLLRFIGVLLLLVLIALPFCIRRLDATPYTQMPFYKTMIQRLDSAAAQPRPAPQHGLRAGWAKVNITPAQPVPTAGYGQRKGQLVAQVHDSLYIRAITLTNGSSRAALVSADLLILPPTVTAALRTQLPAIGWRYEDLYSGTTHTHNSFGGWGKNYVGELFAGTYNDSLVQLVTTGILRAIQMADAAMAPIETAFYKVADTANVKNRLVGNAGTEDPWLRVLLLRQQGGRQCALLTYAAHATTLSAKQLTLSRDYPGLLVDKMEQDNGIDMALFMAGAVGSMAPDEKGNDDWQQLQHIAAALEDKADDSLTAARYLPDSLLYMTTLPLALREPQWRFADNWCFRHWLWSRLYGDYPADLKLLRIGNIVFAGMPCDFSGELVAPLEQLAAAQGLQLVITSFNGSYTGYITKDEYYHKNTYETRIMNWFGPGNGAYFSELIAKGLTVVGGRNR